MDLYVTNEKHDGYFRDNCLFQESIDIFDKMAVQIKYANNVHVSLTTYSPLEGFTIAFNGKNGRYDEIMVSDNFGKYELVKVSNVREGHGGGYSRLQDMIFRTPNAPDSYKQAAGTRDGAMSLLTGVATRKSIDEKRPVEISELTDIVPHQTRGV